MQRDSPPGYQHGDGDYASSHTDVLRIFRQLADVQRHGHGPSDGAVRRNCAYLDDQHHGALTALRLRFHRGGTLIDMVEMVKNSNLGAD